ncbi:MAG: HEPN domain-containing protein [Burkholderiales bacterium]|nr:HEPN domain-containing protein [Burkholderiales bacterium]
MTADELARSYFSRSAKRLLAVELLMQHEAFPDVVREAQELVELVLKGMLRAVGIDPPKWHDVGQILVEHAAKFPAGLQAELPALAAISRRLRRDREAAFYGEIDLIPEQVFDRESARQALDAARRVLDGVRHFDPEVR